MNMSNFGLSMEDLNNYITHAKGTIPLILSVPHGGELLCEDIPTRTDGILGIDKNTIFLTQDLIQQVKNIYYEKKNQIEKPSFIFCNLPRSKIDLNRPIHKAFDQSSILAKIVYFSYHNTLEKYITHNKANYKKSLLLDIHGFEVKSRPRGFRDVDIILGTDNLKSLYAKPIKKKEWSDNIRGNIIKKFLEQDIAIAPGHPRRREYVLSGGYITKKYGASQIRNSQTIQIEFSDRIRIHNEELKRIVLNSLAEVIFKYFKTSNFL
ncbi:MAG: hypothetical protein EU531_06475 [Promethearchaeota archaeon]|nr:MAG: hypothetical protein EU531_06475 [Candidatus Lokiarchaeota archaeon]